ncbi:YciI family protein [Puerhibacterium sp. TATVAM-FAB25]|uniref:YciI family protein n=1 Tax=Puerhibacterium sp. TATVAM-FAB25 TaxID=3093699 RepID=UPI00397CA95E
MAVFVVTYVYAPDSAARRDVVRPEHREFLRGLHAEGRLRLSGPLPATGDQPDGALIVVEADDADGALALLDADPFRREGLVGTRTARELVPVIGGFAG